MPARNRPDKDGTHRGAFEKNKRKIYATRTIRYLNIINQKAEIQKMNW